jgi:hypothetical protein
MTMAFTSQECELFANAVEAAWTHLVETGQEANESLTKTALSRAILHAAGQGERKQELLVAYALAHLAKAKAEVHDHPFEGSQAEP